MLLFRTEQAVKQLQTMVSQGQNSRRKQLQEFTKRRKRIRQLFLELFERFKVKSRYFRPVTDRILSNFCSFEGFEMASYIWDLLDNSLKMKAFRTILKKFIFQRIIKVGGEVVRTRDRVRFPILPDSHLPESLRMHEVIHGGYRMEGLDEIIRDSMMEKLKEEISEAKPDLGRLKRVMKEWWDGLGDDERPLDVPRFNFWNWWDCGSWKEEYCEGVRGFMGCI